MEAYRSEEEQVEALRRWWDENGRSTVVAVVLALAAGFGYQGWQEYRGGQRAQASDMYQAMIRSLGVSGSSDAATPAELAEQLKTAFPDSTYGQFAALHLAAFAVEDGNLDEAQAQLRWVLGKADRGSDTAQVAQLRLARVLASAGETEQALAILEDNDGAYRASYALARGDILLGLGREEQARLAYSQALAEAGQVGANLASVRQKLQSLAALEAASLDEPGMPDETQPESADELGE